MQPGEKSSMLVFKLILGIVMQITILGVLLFLPAGTLHWWRAWVFLGVYSVAGIVATSGLFPRHQDLLDERFKVFHQKGQPLADRIILYLLFADFLGMFVFSIHIEEEFLKRELPGYEAYMERVRYRLIPFIW